MVTNAAISDFLLRLDAHLSQFGQDVYPDYVKDELLSYVKHIEGVFDEFKQLQIDIENRDAEWELKCRKYS